MAHRAHLFSLRIGAASVFWERALRSASHAKGCTGGGNRRDCCDPVGNGAAEHAFAEMNKLVTDCAREGKQMIVADLPFQLLKTLATAKVEPMPGMSPFTQHSTRPSIIQLSVEYYYETITR